MNFDESCTKNNAGAGIWLHNTEKNHAEGHSYRLKIRDQKDKSSWGFSVDY